MEEKLSRGGITGRHGLRHTPAPGAPSVSRPRRLAVWEHLSGEPTGRGATSMRIAAVTSSISSRLVAQQIEADDFEDAFAVAPGADVNVLAVAEFGDGNGGDSGFFAHFAQGGIQRLFAGIDQAFGQAQNGLRFRAGARFLPAPRRRPGPAGSSMAAIHHALSCLRMTTPPAENSRTILSAT